MCQTTKSEKGIPRKELGLLHCVSIQIQSVKVAEQENLDIVPTSVLMF